MPRRNYRQISTGKAVKGVTTVISILEKKALLFWAFKQGMSNFERLMSEISMISQQGEKHKDSLIQTISGFQTTSLYEKRDKAGDAGTLAHSFIENHLKGLPEPGIKGLIPGVINKAEGCYLTFLDWEKANKLKVVASEIELTSEKYAFGGTIDDAIQTVLTPQGMVDIFDLKTGRDIYLEAKIQVKSYGKLWDEHHPELPVAGFHILRLGESGEFTHKYFPSLDEGYWEIFLHCLGVNQALEKLGEKL